jgi:pyocin large subunit-like protein
MKKTPLVISFVLILLGFLWITFNNFDLVFEDGETTIETEALTSTETYTYVFRYQDLYDQHFEKHGHEFGDITKEAYLKLANDLFTSDDALRKTEPDGDLLFYDVASNTFGVLSEEGYIRTCFKPDDGIAYWNRQ